MEHRGCRLAYRLRGRGPAVLLIQGVGVHGDGWLPQVDALAARYQCLTFDNRGMGHSQPAGAAITVEQMAEDARVLMDALGWDAAHVIGHSLGGLVAQHLALSARQRVRSLALLCTFARGRDATRLTLWMFWTGLCTRIGTKRQRRRAFLKLVLPPEMMARVDADALSSQLAPFFGHDLADQPPVVSQQLAALNRYDATPRLPELDGVPTLVASAFHDRIARPELGHALASAIPAARYIEIPNVSHGVPIVQPKAINQLLLEHLSGVAD